MSIIVSVENEGSHSDWIVELSDIVESDGLHDMNSGLYDLLTSLDGEVSPHGDFDDQVEDAIRAVSTGLGSRTLVLPKNEFEDVTVSISVESNR